MAYSVIKTWVPGEILTASDLNAGFCNDIAACNDLDSRLTVAESLIQAVYEIDALRVYGNGTDFTQATITLALTAIGTTDTRTLLLRPGTWVINANADWSAYANVTFKIVPGAVISHGAFTVTFGGPLDAGFYKIFTGSGRIIFGLNGIGGGIDELKAAWWGFDIGASGAVNAAAIQAAITSFPVQSATYAVRLTGKIKLHRGVFDVAPDIIDFANMAGVTLEGVSPAYGYRFSYPGTRLKFSTGTIGINMFSGVVGTTVNNVLRNLTIDGVGVLETGIKAGGNQLIDSVSIIDCHDYGVWLGNLTNNTSLNNINIIGCTSGLGYGLYVNGVNTTAYSVRNSVISENNVGVRMEAGYAVLFDRVIMEDNVKEALYIYRPTAANYLGNIEFNQVWIENNVTGLGGEYAVTINKDAGYDPKNITFRNCKISSGISKILSIVTASHVRFIATNLNSAVADGVLINAATAQYVSFDQQGETFEEPVSSVFGLNGGMVMPPQIGVETLTASVPAAGTVAIYTIIKQGVYLVNCTGADEYFSGSWLVRYGTGGGEEVKSLVAWTTQKPVLTISSGVLTIQNTDVAVASTFTVTIRSLVER